MAISIRNGNVSRQADGDFIQHLVGNDDTTVAQSDADKLPCQRALPEFQRSLGESFPSFTKSAVCWQFCWQSKTQKILSLLKFCH